MTIHSVSIDSQSQNSIVRYHKNNPFWQMKFESHFVWLVVTIVLSALHRCPSFLFLILDWGHIDGPAVESPWKNNSFRSLSIRTFCSPYISNSVCNHGNIWIRFWMENPEQCLYKQQLHCKHAQIPVIQPEHRNLCLQYVGLQVHRNGIQSKIILQKTNVRARVNTCKKHISLEVTHWGQLAP